MPGDKKTTRPSELFSCSTGVSVEQSHQSLKDWLREGAPKDSASSTILFVNYRFIIYASIIAGMPPPDAV